VIETEGKVDSSVEPPSSICYRMTGHNVDGNTVQSLWYPQFLTTVGTSKFVFHGVTATHEPSKTMSEEHALMLSFPAGGLSVEIKPEDWCYGAVKRRSNVKTLTISFEPTAETRKAVEALESNMMASKRGIAVLNSNMKVGVGWATCFQGTREDGSDLTALGVVTSVSEFEIRHTASISQPGVSTGAGLSNGRISVMPPGLIRKWHDYGVHMGHDKGDDSNVAVLGVCNMPKLPQRFR